MANSARRQRRLWDTYSFPGFRPQPTVRGVFGDPKARVITLVRRSKKQPAAVAAGCNRVGTTARRGGGAVCRAGEPASFSRSRICASRVGRGGKGNASGGESRP